MLELNARYIRSGEGTRIQRLQLDVTQTAFLLVDVYLDDQENGRWGPPEDPFTATYLGLESAIGNALDAVRRIGMFVVYATNSSPRVGVERSAFGRHFRRAWDDDFNTAFTDGGVDSREFHQGNRDTPLKFAEHLAPRPDEVYIRKHAYSAFYATRLDTALRNMGIRTLICCGLWANVCLAATSLDALYRNYDVIWLRDGTLAGNQATAQWIAWCEEIVGFSVPSDDLIAACRAHMGSES
jgi:nicotinamidase-related amidase